LDSPSTDGRPICEHDFAIKVAAKLALVTVSKNPENKTPANWRKGNRTPRVDEAKVQKVIDFLIKKGKDGATYRELDMHLAGPTCNKRWLARVCEPHPDIYKEGETSSTRLFYEKGRNELWGNAGRKLVSMNVSASVWDAVREKALEMRISQSEFAEQALRAHLKSLK